MSLIYWKDFQFYIPKVQKAPKNATPTHPKRVGASIRCKKGEIISH